MDMKITFPGGLAVNAEFKGYSVHSDQPVEYGGGGKAPAPFDLFLASIGTCAGLYALRFCQQRNLDTTGLGVTLSAEKDDSGTRIGTIQLTIELPEGFPEKYRDAIIRAADQCAVKRHIMEPPHFEVTTVPARYWESVEA